jgi:Fe-S cluster biogenesis protein NfuA
VKERVEEVLKKVRPYLQRDGGDVELVDVDASGLVKVRLKGACSGCAGATITLKQGIERLLKQEIKEVKRVISV